MEHYHSVFSPEHRIECLESRLRILQFPGSLGLFGCLLVGYFLLQTRSATADGSGQVLRVRGLIVEDALGRPRILLGAPAYAYARASNAGALSLVILVLVGDDPKSEFRGDQFTRRQCCSREVGQAARLGNRP